MERPDPDDQAQQDTEPDAPERSQNDDLPRTVGSVRGKAPVLGFDLPVPLPNDAPAILLGNHAQILSRARSAASPSTKSGYSSRSVSKHDGSSPMTGIFWVAYC